VRFQISGWLFFWLLSIEVPELKAVDITAHQFEERKHYTENLKELSIESLVKLLLFRGKQSIG